MNQIPPTPSASNDSAITAARSPVAAHPITSVAIFILVAGSICGTLIVPIYAHVTPKIGDFPFFYFYLLAYMPVVGVVLGIVLFLQSRMRTPGDGDGRGEVTR